MIAKTIFGLEEVLAEELTALGALNVNVLKRAVSFYGDKGFMYKANLCCRTALRILKPINTFSVKDNEDLYKQIYDIKWEDFLEKTGTLAVDAVGTNDFINHTQYLSQRVKDAIVDSYRDKYGIRPSVDLDNPSLRINIHLFNDQVTVSLDSSGSSLHKRGYRKVTNLAPLNEVLAAGMILLSGWNRNSVFIDPMCGSGTLPIEASLYAFNIPAGYYRKD
ncbi:MAG: THUMP domain-containing protein, partial [Bacteroidota bacterium]|nr:THUMP domain-containing protein [Bacteroidota bacterium]